MAYASTTPPRRTALDKTSWLVSPVASSAEFPINLGSLEAKLRDTRLAQFFATPFLSYLWPDCDELNQDLRRRILAHERDSASKGVSKSNVGGWQSETGRLEWCGEAGKALVARMIALANEATRQVLEAYGKRSPAFTWVVESWANVNRAGDFNRTHIHSGSTWSGTYYVDAGEPPPEAENGTALYLMDPYQAGGGNFFPQIVPTSVFIRPEPGKMVLFPSYLPHMVFPHRGKRPRISIAFNLRKEPFP